MYEFAEAPLNEPSMPDASTLGIYQNYVVFTRSSASRRIVERGSGQDYLIGIGLIESESWITRALSCIEQRDALPASVIKFILRIRKKQAPSTEKPRPCSLCRSHFGDRPHFHASRPEQAAYDWWKRPIEFHFSRPRRLLRKADQKCELRHCL